MKKKKDLNEKKAIKKEIKKTKEPKVKKEKIKSEKVKVEKVKQVKKNNKNKKMSIGDKFMKFIKDNAYDIILAILSLVALIIGSMAIGFKKAIIIVVLLDIIVWFLPTISFIGNKFKRKIKRRTLAQAFLWLVVMGLIACISFATYVVLKAPKFNPDNLYEKESTIIYDKDGAIVAKIGIGGEMREKIAYEEIPEILIDAIIATEDSQFFEHNGFNPLRFVKASLQQVLSGGGGGASTITMQVSKNAFTSFEDSGFDGIVRKFTDIYLSIFKIEKTYTKEEILEFYVNSYYMGSGAWGVEQACQNYFGKSVTEINLSEAALIAGLFKGGGAYDPFVYPENAESRRKIVLSLMQRHGYITEEEKNIASKLTVDDIIVRGRKNESYQAFIDTVTEEVKNKTGQNPYAVPMEIYTTMDTKKQQHVNNIMNGNGYKWENDVVQAGIIVTNTNTGAIVAVGAGRNRKGAATYNYATMIERQIGSTAKPLYDYGPAIEYNNISTGQPIVDEPHSYSNGGSIQNWDGAFQSLTTIRQTLKESRNTTALKTFQSVKNSNIKKFVTNLGLNPELENGMIFESHSLGGYSGESPLSMAAAYAAFANGGTYIEPYSFTKIIYRDTNEEYINTYETRKAMSESTAYMVTSILIDTATYTTGYNRVNGIQYTNKTGTTNFDEATKNKYNLPYYAINDLWSVGYSRDYAIAVWYGYDHITSEYYSYSNGQNSRLFYAIAKGVLSGTKNFTKPKSVSAIEVEKDTSEVKLPSEFTPDNMKRTEYFKVGTEPTETSTRFAKLEDVTGLTVKEENSIITLNWTPIATPNELDRDALTVEFDKLFYKDNSLSEFIDKRLNENNELLGQIEYEVYIKNSDNTLQLLGTTSDNYYQYDATTLQNGSIDFVVKATYSNFKTNASNGSEIEISINNEIEITSNINGQENISLSVGQFYDEPTNAVNVFEGLTDVTNLSTITKMIKDSNGTALTSINTSIPGTYTITYDVTYKKHHNTLTKTITIQ